ncbi:hypothetical protein DFH11DRAFT_1599133 [Phellopilus nigrolimitatus]|nr:hypothetical protein DFH11DRAFT_1599133 [Phellopilus nigrolimitatus]
MPRSISLPLFFLALCLPTLSLTSNRPAAQRRSARNPWRRSSNSHNIPAAGYYDPNSSGGSMLTGVPDTFPAGLGEPLNVILSANSDAAVLVDQANKGGLRNYYQAIGFSSECLGQHSGSDQTANLGDGHNSLNETAVMRWNYGDPVLGTCQETIKGGNHFRYWIQDGSSADSGAIFMALSYEEPLEEEHDIIDNGYNLARDWLVGNATSNTTIPTSNLTNSSTFSGSASAEGYTYQTSVQYVPGLLPNTSNGINHFQSVGVGQNAVDGLVAVLTVKISQAPENAAESSSLRSYTLPTTLSSVLLPFLLYLLFTRRL